MELSCESVRYPEETRPSSSKFVELHVLYVPDDQWNVKLNKIPAEAIESFISAGFIRVFPDITLQALRAELGAFLGSERRIAKFSFLKCVGRSLALVRGQQERDLKVKTFAPPYAPQPELYLLPTMDSQDDLYYRPLTSDTGSSSPGRHTRCPVRKWILPTGTNELVKFPHIPQRSHRSPPTPSLEEEEEEEGDDEQQSFSSSESEGVNEDEAPSSDKFEWEEERLRKSQDQQGAQPPSQTEAASALGTSLPREEESCRKKKMHNRQSRAAGDSGVAESSEDRDSGFSLTDRPGKSQDAQAFMSNKSKVASGVTESPAALARCAKPPPEPKPTPAARQPAGSIVFQTSRKELMEEMELVREERRQLEWKRQELLRKGKDLLAQNRHRRNQARDSWKKKYFDTKKATAPLEDILKSLRQELETFYNKLLCQLHARDSRGKPRRQGQCSIKNELIIQILTESYEIDNLKRKVEDAKMKLVTEMKLRKQAAMELKALKAELAQKKSQSSQPRPVGSWDRPQVQNRPT